MSSVALTSFSAANAGVSRGPWRESTAAGSDLPAPGRPSPLPIRLGARLIGTLAIDAYRRMQDAGQREDMSAVLARVDVLV